MNRIVQPETHPDAELLNGFVEQALPDRERLRVLAHMADCARCREVVYLAQAAAAPEAETDGRAEATSRPDRAPHPEVMGVPRKSRWAAWAGRWRPVLIPAAALAGVATVVLWMQLRPSPRVETAAGNTTQKQRFVPVPESAVAQRQAATPDLPRPAPRPRTDRIAKAEVAKPPQEMELAQVLPAAGSESPAEPEENPATKPTAALIAPAPKVSLQQSASSPLSLANTQFRAMPSTLPRPSASRFGVESTPRGTRAVAALHGAVAAAPATPQGMFSPMGGNAQAQMSPALPSQPLSQVLGGPMAVRLLRRYRLPSGRDSISAASVLNRVLAIDAEGAVFGSDDAGKSWQPIAQRWSGKAVSVESEPGGPAPGGPAPGGPASFLPASVADARVSVGAGDAGAGAASSDKTSLETLPPATPAPSSEAAAAITSPLPPGRGNFPSPGWLFKLTTDRHQTWVSTDGKSWHRE